MRKQSHELTFFALFLCAVFLFLVFAFGSAAHAQNFVPLTGTQVNQIDLAPYMTKAFSSTQGLAPFVNAMFKAAIAIGAMLAVLKLAQAGFLYMGSDVWGQKEHGKQIMRDAVMGLLLLLAIWLILNQINPQLLNLDALNKITPIK